MNAQGVLPPTPREFFSYGIGNAPSPREVLPTPQQIVPNAQEAISGAKDFVTEAIPKPKDVAGLGAEVASSTVMDKVRLVAEIATPPTILIGAVIVAVGVAGGMASGSK